MNSKFFVTDPASYFESLYMGIEQSTLLSECRYVANPISENLINKIIIINLPLELNYNKLARFNKIISRIPIKCNRYELVKYDLSIDLDFINPIIDSELMLSDSLLLNPNYINYLLNYKFNIVYTESNSKDIDLKSFLYLQGQK